MKERKNYLADEERKRRQELLLGLGICAAVLACGAMGVALCSLARILGQPYFPAVNLAGIAVLFIIPGSAAVMLTFFQNIGNTGIWRHIQQAAEICNVYIGLCIPALIAYRFSGHQGYVCGLTLLVLQAAFLGGIGLAYWINHAWRWHLIRTGRFE